MSTRHEDYLRHVKEADRYLAEAAGVERGERFHYAKVYAALAQAHVAMAQLALTELANTPPRLVTGVAEAASDMVKIANQIWQIPDPVPPFMREWPDNVMRGTTAYHATGDISREEGAFFVVTGETRDDWIGEWAEGYGLIEAHFPKSTARPLTACERADLAKKVRT